MKKANLLFFILYLVGLGLATAAFLLFVPEAYRTNVVWLDFAIVLLIITGYFGRYPILFRPLTGFADNVPFLGSYWGALGTYTVSSLGAMVAMYALEVTFPKQALIQGVILFFLLLTVACGYWANAWMSRSTVRDQEMMGGVRRIQALAAGLRTAVAELPASYGQSKTELARVMDDINCLVGSDAAAARESEGEIIALMRRTTADVAEIVPQEELLRSIKQLRVAVSMRKAI